METTREANFDGLVGPTHHYGGLARGNRASHRNRARPSNPRLAARQGLDKMKWLADLGLLQGVLPPHPRPDMETLRALGFDGPDHRVLQQAADRAPEILSACCSASSMWAANAATVSPSADCADRRVHFTVANLQSHFHRSLEAATTARVLRQIFADDQHFVHHRPLPPCRQFGDEGAANHNRLCGEYGDPGVELFVYGHQGFGAEHQPSRYAARQSLEASRAIARNHRLDPARTLFARQRPGAIARGVFHNDVICVANRQLLFCHEQAFTDQADLYGQLQRMLPEQLQIIEVPATAIDLETAVRSYLFNSQLLSLEAGQMLLLVPSECVESRAVNDYLEHLVQADNPIADYRTIDLRQSMRNGGGPACLRLRVVLTSEERQALNPSVLLTPALYGQLCQWIDRHYRDRLETRDLADPMLLDESRRALDELSQLLGFRAIYPFQHP